MKILTVIGARSHFVKAAPLRIVRWLKRALA
jgi:hypothetical protein